MKKFSFLALSLLATAFVGCKEDNPVIDEPVVVTPEVTLEAGETTETTIAFTVTSKDAEAVAYLVYDGETVPAAEDIFANGTAVEVNKTVEVTVEELTAETTYGVIAAARNGEEVKVADAIELTTLKAEGPDGPDGPDGPEEEIKIARVEGGLNSFKEYRLWLHLNNGGLVYLTVNCVDSEHNILPANEYPVVFMGDPEAEVETDYDYYVHGDGSSYQLGYDMVAIREGKLVVTHLETEGYGLDLDVILDDEEKTALKLSFEGVIPASEIGGDFRNPPYVEPDKNTVEVTITDLGAAFGNEPGTTWYFWIDTQDDDKYSAWLQLHFPKVTDGVLPAATYTWAKDYSTFQDDEGNVKAGEYRMYCGSSYDSHLVLKEDESYVALVEGSTLKVEHDTANKAYILTLNLVGENGDTVTSTYTATTMRKQWDWAGANEFKFPGEGGAAPGYAWEYMHGRVYNSSNFALLGRTIDQTTEFFFDMYCPAQSQNVLPAATYVVGGEGDYTIDAYSYVKLDGMAQSEYLQGGNVVVEHVNGVYKVTCDVTTTSGANFAFVYEGRIEDGVGEGFLNPGEGTQEPEPTPGEGDCTMKGACRSNAFELWVYEPEQTSEILYISGSHTGTIMNVIPEGEYPFYAEYKENMLYVNASWSASYNPDYVTLAAGGKLVVAHTDNGYDISVECTDANGVEYSYSYVGPMEAHDDWSSVGNPPIPYDENTYDLTIDTVVGQASSGNFYLYATSSNGYEFCFNVKSEGKGYDGIIPAGTYSIGGTDYVMSANDTWMRFEEEGESIGFSEGTLAVEHLAEGYKLTFSGKNLLKTTYNFTFEGVVGTHEYAQYPFENPGVEIPAYWDFVFTTCTYSGLKSDNEGNQTIRAWDFTNEVGDKFSLYLDATFTENGVVAGTYTSCYGFESWYGYTPGQQKFTQCPLDPHDSPQSYSFWVADGAFNITDAGSGNFDVSWSGYLWIADGYKKVKISYTGAMPME
ncbi:MAG: hypothetical protein IJD53_05330 [Alistipes sp.]|nr:hypothetical protein [Alistipes sp.]